MPLIDPTTPIGKLRLRVGDFGDIPILPDSVYQSVLDDTEGNLPKASNLLAQYILATLTASTHRKLGSLETWGGERFKNYVEFLKLTMLNPNLMQLAPVPYDNTGSEDHPLIKFVEDWNSAYGTSGVVIPSNFNAC